MSVFRAKKKYEFKDYAGFDCGGIEIGLKTWGELENPRKGFIIGKFESNRASRLYARLLLY